MLTMIYKLPQPRTYIAFIEIILNIESINYLYIASTVNMQGIQFRMALLRLFFWFEMGLSPDT